MAETITSEGLSQNAILNDFPKATSFPPGGNYSGALNNYLQTQKQLHLLSWAERWSATPGEAMWTVECKIGGEIKGTGVAMQKSAARHAAAKQACEVLIAKPT